MIIQFLVSANKDCVGVNRLISFTVVCVALLRSASACLRASAIKRKIDCWRGRAKDEQRAGTEPLLQDGSQEQPANGQV